MDPRQHIRADDPLGIVKRGLLENLTGFEIQQAEHDARRTEINSQAAKGRRILEAGEAAYMPCASIRHEHTAKIEIPAAQTRGQIRQKIGVQMNGRLAEPLLQNADQAFLIGRVVGQRWRGQVQSLKPVRTVSGFHIPPRR